EGDEVGQHSLAQLARVPTESSHPAGGRGAQKVLRLVQHTPPGRAALVDLEGADLFEYVRHCVGVAARAQSASRLGERAQRTDAVTKVAFRRRTRADRHLVLAKERDVVLADVDRMHGGEVGAEDALSLEQLSRCAALDCKALFDFRRLLRKVDVKWHAPL